jgi:hypothetical protein
MKFAHLRSELPAFVLLLSSLPKVFQYFTLRQAQGEERIEPHAELVEAFLQNFCQGT